MITISTSRATYCHLPTMPYIILMAVVMLWGMLSMAEDTRADTATYDVTFTSIWSAQTHPTDFPPGPHYSGLVGATHTNSTSFWSPGSIASRGVEQVAEDGAKSGLISEVNQAISSGAADQVLSGPGLGFSPGSVIYRFTIDRQYPLVTLITMLAPSPDWFAGINGVSMLNSGGKWRNSLEISLNPYDAGTDNGNSYRAANSDTQPRQTIRNIRGVSPFANRPIASMRFIRVDTPAPSISIGDITVNESAGTVTLPVQLSSASDSNVQVTASSVDGTAQSPGDYVAFTNLVEFAPGETAQQIIINIVNDTAVENEETLAVVLSNSVNADITASMATIKIIDDDEATEPLPRIVTTPDRAATGNYGWAHFADGGKQWIDAGCRARLSTVGWSLAVREWSQIEALPDRAPVSCDQLVSDNQDRGDGSDLLLMTTADKSADGNYAWIIYDGVRKHWVDADCRAQLQMQGVSLQIRTWSHIDAISDTSTRPCNDIVPSNEASVRILATPDRGDDGHYGWFDFGNGTKQWIDAACRSQLVNDGVTLDLQPWMTIAANEDTQTRLTCTQLSELSR